MKKRKRYNRQSCTVSILSPAKVVAKTTAQQVQVPGLLGCMGILPGHTRMVAELGGRRADGRGRTGGKQTYFVAGGYLDVAEDNVTVLVDVVEKPGDIDTARAEKALKRAQERLASNKIDVDLKRAQASLSRAEGRLAAAAKARG